MSALRLRSILRLIGLWAVTVGLLWTFTAVVSARPLASTHHQGTPFFGTIPPVAPVLLNPDFECAIGYYTQTNAIGKVILVPDGWQLTILNGAPKVYSARIQFAKSCDGSAHVEKINLEDSLVVSAQDLETPPAPGKPFDMAISQQVSATVGGIYSLSGWFLSLCGGSAVPNDCPQDVYMAKMLGIDPTGGIDPTAASVIWTENRHNFIEDGKRVGWQQMSVSAMAHAPTITVFARINSPFRWHGNHAFIDALSLVRAPLSALTVPATVTGTSVTLQWEGLQSEDIAAIAGGTYTLSYDIQFRHQGVEDWRDLLMDRKNNERTAVTVNCTDTSYDFRIRTRAEQPPAPAPAGAWPNHRYYGIWSEPIPVQFLPEAAPVVDDTPVELPGPFRLYLPQVAQQKQC